MQISTSQFYNLNQQNMSSLLGQADTLQTQISTGKKINTPSDDAVSYRRLQTIAQGTADDKAYTSNITLASSTLSQADVTLSSITNEIQSAQETAIKANSGTLSQSDRNVLADQLDSILQTLIGLANTKARLEQLYGGNQRIEFGRSASGGASVRIIIPFRRVAA